MVLRKGEQVGSFRARMNAVFTMYRPGGSGASFSLAARGSVWRGSDHSMTNVFPPTRGRSRLKREAANSKARTSHSSERK